MLKSKVNEILIQSGAFDPDEVTDAMTASLVEVIETGGDLRKVFEQYGITAKSFEGGTLFNENGITHDLEDYEDAMYLINDLIEQLSALKPVKVPKPSSGTELYQVTITKLDIGMRIEGFSVKTYLFNDRKKAIKYAHSSAKKEIGDDVSINDDGEYSIEDESYGCWDAYSCRVEPVVLYLDNEVVIEQDFSA